MSVKELLISAPALCGAAYPKKHGQIARLAWEYEEKNNGFPRIPGETARQRIDFLFDWGCKDFEKQEYCAKLATLAVLSHYGLSHDDPDSLAEALSLSVELEALEPDYSDVSAILTVESASAMGNWF
jgi:hypothetical protein